MSSTVNIRVGGVANSPVILAQTAIPVIVVPNGTVATNGTITVGTALPTTYASAWIYLPSGAVSGDATGGLYYTVFSNTTTGVVYLPKQGTTLGASIAFQPYIPQGTLTAVTGSNSAYTQTTGSDIALANITVPGGLMGQNGALRTTIGIIGPSNANTKFYKSILGGTQIMGVSATTSSYYFAFPILLRNRGLASSQTTSNWGGSNSSTISAFSYLTINTAIDQPLTLTGQLAVSTDYIVLEGYSIEVLPG